MQKPLPNMKTFLTSFKALDTTLLGICEKNLTSFLNRTLK